MDVLGLLDRLFDLPSRLFEKHRRIVQLRREAGLIEECTEGVCDGAGERLQVVPSFQEEDAATAAELLCQLLDARCQHIERARCELQPSQGVQCMRIVPEKDMSSFGLAYMTPMRISSRASTQWVCGTKGMRIFSIFRFRTVCLAGLKLALWKEDLTQLKQGLYQA